MGIWNKKDNISDEDDISFKVKLKRLLIRILIMSAVGLIYAGIGFLIAYLIASRNDYKLQDVAFSTGCLIVVLGLFMMMKGNPTGASMSSWGSKNTTAINHWNMNATLQERESTNYYRDFRKHAMTEFTTNRFSFLLGGIFLAAISILIL